MFYCDFMILCQCFEIRNDYKNRKSTKIEENFKLNNPKLKIFLKLNVKLIDVNKFLYNN